MSKKTQSTPTDSSVVKVSIYLKQKAQPWWILLVVSRTMIDCYLNDYGDLSNKVTI